MTNEMFYANDIRIFVRLRVRVGVRVSVSVRVRVRNILDRNKRG